MDVKDDANSVSQIMVVNVATSQVIPSVRSIRSNLYNLVDIYSVRPILADRAKYIRQCTDDLYKWQASARQDQPPFVLHDGPPYANGSLHIGHALNKILKDMICRTALQRGRNVRWVPGWDCHGLPIEIKALESRMREKLGDVRALSAINVRSSAKAWANNAVKNQKKSFKEWAIMADWENSWTTMDKSYEIAQLNVFKEMVRKGLIFRRFKPVYWSPSSQSALAEAELEYREDHTSTAAFVSFPIVAVPDSLKRKGIVVDKLNALIWTTTPWTLPANQALAVGPDLTYVVIRHKNDHFLLAESRLDHVAEICSWNSFDRVVESIKGSELVGSSYRHILRGAAAEPQRIIAAGFVSEDSGTGVVHCAPGHGMDDYEVCLRQGIKAHAPVNDLGRFTEDAFPENPKALQDVPVLETGSSRVLALIPDCVLATHQYQHKYPYDWRTKLPVIVRATEQWFADVGSIKQTTLASLDDVEFIPEAGRARLESFVRSRSEWCISRQRAWGVPIPALFDSKGKAVLDEESVAHITSVIKERGINAWWTDSEDDTAWIPPARTGKFRRGKDTMDVWFDSGSSWTQTPVQADVYCEGTDQHRGWFQSSLLTHSAAGTGAGANAPFRKLVTHGFTLDQDGRKMSKSIGNVIAPQQIMDGSLLPPIKRKGQAFDGKAFDGLGPDALRLWVASSDFTRDVVVGEPVLRAVHTSLLKFRTTLKMLLGSIHEDSIHSPLTKLDHIALRQLEKVMLQVTGAFETYDFHKAVTSINRWINTDLSAFYLEAMKDRLYCGDGGGALQHIFAGLCQMLIPITPVLVEEVWDHRPRWMVEDASYQHPARRIVDREHPIAIDMDRSGRLDDETVLILNANAAIKAAQEEARTAKLIGSSLQSSVVLSLPETAIPIFRKYEDELRDIFVVSSVDLNARVDAEWQFSAEFDACGGKGRAIVLPPTEHKCPRCWRYLSQSEDSLCSRCTKVLF